MENKRAWKKFALKTRMQHTLYKGTHKWDNMSPCMSRNPMPKSITPIHLTLFTWLREGLPGKHSLTWGMIHPIGHHDNPPIPKFGKLHKVFEHLFILRGGIWCTCSGGSFTIYGLLDMMLVTCEPLEGEFACLCRALTSEKILRGGTRSLGLSLGAWSPQDGWCSLASWTAGSKTLPLEALGYPLHVIC